MAAKVILDPNFRPMSPLFDNGELERLRSFAEVVWARDEPMPKDHPIRQAPGTILSAHRAGGGAETYHRLGRMIVNDLQAILSGLPPQEMQVAQPEIIQQRG
ncbi:MAG TPA: hypothetical protein VFB21_13100 [Chthonomonadaceae bacterium]|nr:hypothetical protein [Chthonomonadaceae bacterium]